KIISKRKNVYRGVYECEVEEVIDSLLEDKEKIVSVGDICGKKVYMKSDSIECFRLWEGK
ncbi:hypothetical protein, partial [Staphylococcus warneri]|uniref:hypothetical protein n=1 Tax=Staphylococcus warneri TaxID=1292 RepID=UPI001C92D113